MIPDGEEDMPDGQEDVPDVGVPDFHRSQAAAGPVDVPAAARAAGPGPVHQAHPAPTSTVNPAPAYGRSRADETKRLKNEFQALSKKTTYLVS